MFDINTILIGAAKFISATAFFIVAVNFGINTKKEIDKGDPTYTSVGVILWGRKFRLLALLGVMLTMIYIFNIEAAFRPKHDVSKLNPPQEMVSSHEQQGVIPEVKPDYDAMLKASHDQAEIEKEKFRQLK